MSSTFHTGRLLVATPSVEGEVFHRSVILMLHHDDGGAQGVVLNKPLTAEVDSVLPGWQRVVTAPHVLFQGGPVSTSSALGLVTVPGDVPEPLGVKRLFGSIGLVDLDVPTPVVAAELARMRIFAGYPAGTRASSRARSCAATGTSSTRRAVTRSPLTPRVSGGACCAVSATAWPTSRASPTTPR